MSGPLRGGRRRRRLVPALLVLFVLALPVAAAAGAYLWVTADDGPGAQPEVVDTPSVVPEEGGSLEARSPAPVRLTGGNAFDPRFRKAPRAALVFDVDDGRVLIRREPERVLPMASLTKIMTALAVTSETRPDEKVRITPAALKYQGSGVGVLPKGKRVPLEALMNGLMLVSGNDAAIALADHVSGSERQFVRLMNEKARLWGLRCTRFASSHGLEKGNRSCAADLAVMTRLAMRNPRITGIVRRKEASFRFPIKGGKLYLYGHNPLIRAGYRGAIGLKTGYTDEAGRCFVGVARRDGRTLGVVLLHSPNPLKHATALLDQGFRAEGAR
ncbi:MAG TPA: D-alanyl-D-alanine carboxypeptidase family protein [Thermoleophilaceae bacterium]|nr:D-alanyl-D-alanine carboxypeptidase family protein [Thermoleophilaceae bacterium]